MLVIRNEQLEVFSRGTEDEYVEFLVEHIKSEDPEVSSEYSDDELRHMVRTGIARAESYDIKLSKDQSAFVAIMFEVSPNFDDQPEIKAVLDDRERPADERIERLWSQAVPDEIWEKAAEEYDEAAWKLPPKPAAA